MGSMLDEKEARGPATGNEPEHPGLPTRAYAPGAGNTPMRSRQHMKRDYRNLTRPLCPRWFAILIRVIKHELGEPCGELERFDLKQWAASFAPKICRPSGSVGLAPLAERSADRASSQSEVTRRPIG